MCVTQYHVGARVIFLRNYGPVVAELEAIVLAPICT